MYIRIIIYKVLLILLFMYISVSAQVILFYIPGIDN